MRSLGRGVGGEIMGLSSNFGLRLRLYISVGSGSSRKD